MDAFNNPDLSDRILIVKVGGNKPDPSSVASSAIASSAAAASSAVLSSASAAIEQVGTKRRRLDNGSDVEAAASKSPKVEDASAGEATSLDEEDPAPVSPADASASADVSEARSEARYHVSRGVLALASTFFAALFTSLAGDRNAIEFEIELESREELTCFEIALKFYYKMSGSVSPPLVSPSKAKVVGLLTIADRFGMPKLLQAVLSGVSSFPLARRLETYQGIWAMPIVTIGPDHVPTSIDPHLNLALQNQCEDILKISPISLLNTIPLLNAIGLAQLKMWITSPRLIRTSENDLFLVLTRWMQRHTSISSEEIEPLFKEIRLAHITSSILSTLTKPEEFERQPPFFREIVLKAASFRLSKRREVDAAKLGLDYLARPPSSETLLTMSRVSIAHGETRTIWGMDESFMFSLKVEPAVGSQESMLKILRPDSLRHKIRVGIGNDLTTIPIPPEGVRLSDVRYEGSKFVEGPKYKVQIDIEWKLVV